MSTLHTHVIIITVCKLVGFEGRSPLGRPRRRWEDNVRMDLQEVGCGCEDWIGSGWLVYFYTIIIV
jgi:hypothetical protein